MKTIHMRMKRKEGWGGGGGRGVSGVEGIFGGKWKREGVGG